MTVTEADLAALLRDAAAEIRPDPRALEAILGSPAPAEPQPKDQASPGAPKRPSRFLRLLIVVTATLLAVAVAAAALVVAGVVSVAPLIFPRCFDSDWSTSGDGPFDSIPGFADLIIDPDSWSVTSYVDAAVDGDLTIDAGSAGIVALSDNDLEGVRRIEVRYEDGVLAVLVGSEAGPMSEVLTRASGGLDLREVALRSGTGSASGSRVRVDSPIGDPGTCRS